MHSISNKKLEIVFDDNPVFIKCIKNKLTGEQLCKNGRQTIIIRNPLYVSDPHYLFEAEVINLNGNDFELIFRDDSGNKAGLKIIPEEDDIKFQINVEAAEPVWLVEWRADRKSTRLNSSHVKISYAVFCLKKKREESPGES